jgi:hypothetical protein
VTGGQGIKRRVLLTEIEGFSMWALAVDLRDVFDEAPQWNDVPFHAVEEGEELA